MAFRWFSTKKLTYNIIPAWQKPIFRDPFDYPLRSYQEVQEEIKNRPPVQRAHVQLSHYYDNDPRKIDLRATTIKMFVSMRDWNLTTKQKERLIFLLGPRYKENDEFKIVVNQFSSREQNMQKCLDTLHELCMECKRAP